MEEQEWEQEQEQEWEWELELELELEWEWELELEWEWEWEQELELEHMKKFYISISHWGLFEVDFDTWREYNWKLRSYIYNHAYPFNAQPD